MLAWIPVVYIALSVILAAFVWSFPLREKHRRPLRYVRWFLGSHAIVSIYYLGASPVIESPQLRFMLFALLPAAIGAGLRLAYERRHRAHPEPTNA